MATMTNAEILVAVKSGMGISGDYQDTTLQTYINDIQNFMLDAGVSETMVSDSSAIGCILRGVIDTWDYGNGSAGFSDIFKMRLSQLTSGN
jgi:hypothetical protein